MTAPTLNQYYGGGVQKQIVDFFDAQNVEEADYYLYDDFTQGAQGLIGSRVPLIGMAGQSWTEKNISTSAPVDGATVTTPGYSVITAQGLSSNRAPASTIAAYNILRLADVPGEIGFTFSLADNANQYTPTVASWLGGLMTQSGVGGVHLQIKNLNAPTDAQTGWNPMYYQGGAGVGSNQWDEEGSGYTKFNQVPGAVYTCRIFLAPPFVLYQVLDAGGNMLSTKLAYDARINNVIGPWFFIETFNTSVTYKSVWARKKLISTVSLRQFLGGIDGTPIGMRNPAAGVFSTLHVGQGQPQGVFGATYNGLLASRPGVALNSSAVGDAIWEVKAPSTATGYAAQTWLTNWQNMTAVYRLDNNGAVHFVAPNDYVGGQVDWFGKNFQGVPYMMLLPNYASDAAAATGGVPVGGLYRNGSVVQQRVT